MSYANTETLNIFSVYIYIKNLINITWTCHLKVFPRERGMIYNQQFGRKFLKISHCGLSPWGLNAGMWQYILIQFLCNIYIYIYIFHVSRTNYLIFFWQVNGNISLWQGGPKVFSWIKSKDLLLTLVTHQFFKKVALWYYCLNVFLWNRFFMKQYSHLILFQLI